MAATCSLRMRFLDSNERIVSFTVTPAKTPVVVSDVTDLMDLIITTNAFYTYTDGDIVSKVDAVLITTEKDELDINA